MGAHHDMERASPVCLWTAVREDDVDGVHAALCAGENARAQDTYGSTPLHWARSAHVVRALCAAGVDVQATDGAGRTPLHWAALRQGSGSVTRALLAAGASASAVDKTGNTPLHVVAASLHGDDDTVKALLIAGADALVAGKGGRTPLQMARDACKPDTVAILKAAKEIVAAEQAARANASVAERVCMGAHEGVRGYAAKDDAETEAASLTAASRSAAAVTTMERAHTGTIVAMPTAGSDALLGPPAASGGAAALPGASECIGPREEGPASCTHASGCELPPADTRGATLEVSVLAPTFHPGPAMAAVTTSAAVALIAVAPPPAAAAAPAVVCEISLRDLAFDRDEDGIQVELGQGAYGIVYAGRWKGERVAIKKMTLPLEWISSGRFWSEVHLHMQASHRHVVRVYGAAVKPAKGKTTEMACYMVMDRLVTDLSSALHDTFEGGHPAHRVAAAVRPLPQRLRLLLEIARGLRFLHARGIVHADLKPGNVMLDADGHAQLTDFGLAVQRALDASHTRSSHKGERGTLVYMDPALAGGSRGASVKPASDMYSWGVLAWEVLTLRKPREEATSSGGSGGDGGDGGDGASASIPSFSRLTFGGERPEAILARLPDVPLSLRDLIQRCWAEEQRARPCAEAAITVLEGIVEAARASWTAE